MRYVAHMTKVKPMSTVASARIAKFICEQLKFELIDSEEAAKEVKEIETLVVVNGPMAFCSFLEELSRLVRIARKVVWAQNDYTLPPPKPESNAESPFRRVFADRKLRPVFWTNCEENVRAEGDVFINWNQLTYALEDFPEYPKDPTLLYYGAYRKGREPYFDKWFKSPPYRAWVSAPAPSATKFKNRYPDVLTIKPINWSLPVRATGAIYMADNKSCLLSHPPANRFFEMLSKRIPIWFDLTVAQSLRRSGLALPSEYVVGNQYELNNALERFNPREVAEEQTRLWHRDYKGQLSDTLCTAFHQLKELK